MCYWQCNKYEITPWPSLTGEITFPTSVSQRENTSPRSVTDTVLLLERLLHKYVWQDLTGKSHSKVRQTQSKVLYVKGFFCWVNKCFKKSYQTHSSSTSCSASVVEQLLCVHSKYNTLFCPMAFFFQELEILTKLFVVVLFCCCF